MHNLLNSLHVTKAKINGFLKDVSDVEIVLLFLNSKVPQQAKEQAELPQS